MSFLNRPCPTHWSNAFCFRRRETVGADAGGKPQLVIGSDMLEMLGLSSGDEVIVKVTDDGAILVRRSEV